jgi:hypothetical protein
MTEAACPQTLAACLAASPQGVTVQTNINKLPTACPYHRCELNYLTQTQTLTENMNFWKRSDTLKFTVQLHGRMT